MKNEDQKEEKKVETVDYQSSAGQCHEVKKPVQVIHQPHPSNDTDGVLANAATTVANTLQSAKETVSRE